MSQDVIRQVLYFNEEQFVTETDFNQEQAYHLDSRQRTLRLDDYETASPRLATGAPGELDIQGAANVKGDLKIHGAKPIIIRRYERLGNHVDKDTGVNATNYIATIGGFSAGSAEIKDSRGDFIRLFMHIHSDKWHIRADRHPEADEDWWADVMFIRSEMAAFEVDGGADNVYD
ncbi:MAG: hypothetical protein GY856_28815 [bacterium]|nr:hypothetical protein [bacterium]